MQTTQLGDSGARVSRMALGALQMGNATDEQDARRILGRFFDSGGNVVDTADMYEWYAYKGSPGGQSEEVVGKWMRRRDRAEVFLSSKGGGMPKITDDLWKEDGTPDWEVALRTFPDASASNLRLSLEGSLRRLQTDYIDLYYVHVDDPNTPIEETLSTLNDFVTEGKVRFIGWSNTMRDRLEEIHQVADENGWVRPVALQLQHSYLRPSADVEDLTIADDDRLNYLAKNNMTLFAYSPILKGVYSNVSKREQHPVMANYAGAATDERLAAVSHIASALGVSANAVVLAWLMLSSSPTVVPLIGPRTSQQLDELLEAAVVTFTDEQLTQLNDAGR